jgi:hypothetical protein
MALRRRWSETVLERELTPIVAELGRLPTRKELADRGIGGAWSAMQRHGGVEAWRSRLTPPSAAPTADDNAVRAYFIAQQHGGDPLANWFAAERELLAA